MSAKILITEDEIATRQIFASILKDIGYDVVTAEDGLECIQKAQMEKPDLILLDIQMPVMNGFEALKRIKQNPKTREIPVIILSGNTEPENIQKGLDLGADEYLAKPINIEELIVRVKSVLKAKETSDELKKLKSEFTYLLIQDLKNTITAIKSSIELALKTEFTNLTEEQKAVLEIAESAIEEHLKLLDEYRELLRLEYGVEELKLEKLNLNDVIKSSVTSFKRKDKTGSEINIETPTQPAYVEGDEGKLKRAIEIALQTIIDTQNKSIKISLKQLPEKYLVEIFDKTTTISESEAELIFDKYLQAKLQRLSRYKGLGPTICKIIIEAHGGKIYAKPVEDGGTKFFIELPRAGA